MQVTGNHAPPMEDGWAGEQRIDKMHSVFPAHPFYDLARGKFYTLDHIVEHPKPFMHCLG
jgi:hypothetical protein